MKKIITLILVTLIAFTAFAVSAQNTETPALISASADVVPEKTYHFGTVSEVTDEYIIIGEDEYQFNTDTNTYICDYELNPVEEVKKGDFITAVVNIAQTMSIPPQSYAHYILVNTEKSESTPVFAVVDTNENGEIMSKDGNNKIVYTVETPVKAHKIRMMLRGADITPGSEILAFASVVGLSLPAHVAAEKILVLSLAEQAEETPATQVTAITVDGEEFDVDFDYADTALFNENSDPRLPLRKVCEALGFEVIWHDEDWSIDIVSAAKNTIRIKIGEAMTEGQKAENIPALANSTTYVTSEIFGLLYGEDASVTEENGIITITTK